MGASPVIFFIHTAKVLYETVKTCQYVEKNDEICLFFVVFVQKYVFIYIFLPPYR